MNNINPTALTLIAICTVIGALSGHVLIGLLIGLSIVFVASITS